MDALAAWLWQGSVVTLAVAAGLRLLPRVSAATRHLAWWLTLCSVVALPIAHAARTSRPGDDDARAEWSPTCAGRDARLAGAGAVAPGGPSCVAVPKLAAHSGSATASEVPGSGAPVTSVAAWTLPAPPDWAVATALGAWLGFVVLSLVRVGRGVSHVRRLARRAVPMPPSREARLCLWTTHRRAGRPMTLRVSRDVRVPCALGLGPATILVPHGLFARIEDEALDQLVMHERAHLLRYDDWTRLAEALVTSVAGVHPAVGWIARQIDFERETACDDLVVQATGDAHRYATCLATAASAMTLGGLRSSPLLAPGALRSPGLLERRVRRLFDRRHNGTTSPSRALLLVTTCALLAVAQALVQASPLVRFGREVLPTPAAPASGGRAADSTPDIDLGPLVRADVQPGPPADGSPTRSTRVEARGDHDNSRRAGASRPDFPGQAFSLSRLTAAVPVQPDAGDQHVQLPAVLPVEMGVRPAPVDVMTVPSGHNTSDVRGDRSPWSGVAQAGNTVGVGAKKAGVAVGGFFTRAGHAVGDSFTR
jgi:beta-lactamase regulating signal transducer with metallopeptidase domain